MKIFRSLTARSLAALALCLSAVPLRAQDAAPASGASDIGTVRASEFSPNKIAIPPFDNSGTEALSGPILSDTVERDLTLSGFFRKPESQQVVTETHALDQKEQSIHYADWYRLGISYVLKGIYKINGGKIECEVRVYDTTAGKYIFGKNYQDWPKDNPRRLAHYISNDVIQKITGVQGFATTKFLFVGETGVNNGQVSKEIFIMDADGENRKQLSNDKNLAATPTWGMKGVETYFTTYKDFNPDLQGLLLDGSYSWFVSRRAGFNLSPDWSEKRKQIALTLSKDGNSEIYLIDRAGKGLTRLTFQPTIDSSPSWSPDGTQIAFTSDRTGGPQIHVMDASGMNVRRLTKQGSYNDGACWSPRGDLIAYCSRIGGTFQIFTVSPTGDNVRQLTNGNTNCEDPSFSPNGWVISYTGDKSGTKQIHTMFIDGRPLAQLTKGKGAYSCDWSPILP